MLELRAFASGANAEYQQTARYALKKIREILGSPFVRHFNIVS